MKIQNSDFHRIVLEIKIQKMNELKRYMNDYPHTFYHKKTNKITKNFLQLQRMEHDCHP